MIVSQRFLEERGGRAVRYIVRRRLERVVVALLAGTSGVFVVAGIALAAATGVPPTLGPLTSGTPGSTSITLSGALNPNGSDTTYVFNYGTTTAYGLTTRSQDLGSGTSLVTVSTQLTGLAPGTTYHFDLVATSVAGTAATGDLSFTTANAGTTGTTTQSGSALPQPTATASDRLVRVPVANPPGWFDSLDGVSCASESFCLAAGFAGQGHGAIKPIIERWSGRSLTTLSSPSTPGAALSSISCPSASSCMVVGRDGLDTYSEHWSGRGWQVERTPSPSSSGNDILNAVSCPSTTNCWAAGLKNGGTPVVAVLVEHWNGVSWSIVGAPAPAGSALAGLSCASGANCWAVGERNASAGPPALLAEHWNGATWSMVGVPGASGDLLAVSCRRASSCWGTGTSGNDLIVRFESGTWRRATAPARATFDAVDCASARDCWAVGGQGAQWNGRTWTTASAATGGGNLLGISCSTSTLCLAVGTVGQSVTAQRGFADVTRAA